MINRTFVPGGARRGVRDESNLINRQIGQVAARVFRRQCKPFDLLRFGCPGLDDEFDLGRLVRRDAPNIVCRRLAIFNLKMQLRRLAIPKLQQLLPTRGIVAHRDVFGFG